MRKVILIFLIFPACFQKPSFKEHYSTVNHVEIELGISDLYKAGHRIGWYMERCGHHRSCFNRKMEVYLREFCREPNTLEWLPDMLNRIEKRMEQFPQHDFYEVCRRVYREYYLEIYEHWLENYYFKPKV